MVVYVSMILILGICFIINYLYLERQRINAIQVTRPSMWSSILIVAILSLIAGLRYQVGADFAFYYSNYEYCKTTELKLFDEPGLRILARVAEFIYDDPATLIFISAFITVNLMVITVLRNSEKYWLSILLYIFLGEWAGCFNGIRQYLAVAVLFAGHHFIKEKKIWNWLLIVAVAMLFHITAVIGVFFYFYPRMKLSLKNVMLSIVAAFVGIRVYDRIFALIGFIKQEDLILEGKRATYILNSINPLRIAVAWVPVAFFLLLMKYYDTKQDDFRFYMNMSILNACLMTTAMNSAYLGRVGSYTNVYNALVWPLLLKKVNKESQKILIILMILFYMLYWLVEMSKEDLAVFSWVFQR